MCFAAHRLIDYWMPIDHLGRMDTTKLLLESIATRKCVETVYNRMAVKLAPHILYTRHDELFIDAVTIEREGKPPREIKIGTFNLAGLSQLALTNQEFQPEDRKRVEMGKGVSVRLVIGGLSTSKKKKNTEQQIRLNK